MDTQVIRIDLTDLNQVRAYTPTVHSGSGAVDETTRATEIRRVELQSVGPHPQPDISSARKRAVLLQLRSITTIDGGNIGLICSEFNSPLLEAHAAAKVHSRAARSRFVLPVRLDAPLDISVTHSIPSSLRTRAALSRRSEIE